MLWNRYKRSWTGAVNDSATKNNIIAVLLLTNVIALFGWFRSHETVVLVPPGLHEEVTVSVNKASEGYKTAWGIHVAMLLGNVTPGNAEFITSSIGNVLDPTAYRAMAVSLGDQLKAIKDDSITVSFEPLETIYEPETNKVFVFGKFQSVGVTGKPKTFMRTYEMIIEMRYGRPWVTWLSPYQGSPMTMDAIKARPRPIVQAEN